jgi:His/Glu/Gln/Arg/opine family amino acid ABC transporter permease subunit
VEALFQGFGLQFAWGAALTITLAAASLTVGVVIGLVTALAKIWGGPVLRAVADVYTTVVRGVPDLLVIFVVYYGGTVALAKVFGGFVEVSPFGAGVAALGIVSGAYLSEIFRGAIIGVPREQIEGAKALGLAPKHVFFLVTLPQAWRLALPPFGNQTLILTKQTSLVSIVGLEDIMRKASIGAGFTREPFTYYLVAALIYLCITIVLSWAFRVAEQRAAQGLARV